MIRAVLFALDAFPLLEPSPIDILQSLLRGFGLTLDEAKLALRDERTPS